MEMAVESAGEGEPLVLLHGITATVYSWRLLIPLLARDYRVIAVDAWGHGRSDRCAADGSLRGHARRLLSLLDAMHLDRVALVGTSYGGAVAMQAAAIAPDRISRLVLIAPAHPFAKRPIRLARFYSTRAGRSFAQLLNVVPAPLFRIVMARMYADPARCTLAIARDYLRPMKTHDSIRCALASAIRYPEDMRTLQQELALICHIPVDMIWGDHDPVVPPSTIPALQRCFDDVSLQIIPRSGHLPYEEKPEELASAVKHALNSARNTRE